MLLIGLTGNYGMGKSAVLDIFNKLGAYTIDADKIVNELLEDTGVRIKIKNLLGAGFFNPDGSLDRKKVSEKVFSDESLRTALEDIIHPLVFSRVSSIVENVRDKQKVIIVEVPLLFERGYNKRFDRTVTVFTSEDTALGRLRAKGMDIKDALKRMKAQMPVEEKKRKSDFIIDNNGEPETTMTIVEQLYNKFLKEDEDGNNKGT